MRPTIADIAEQAGVSQATVDRVLNARAGVRKHTIDLVLQTADALGYLNSAQPTPTETRTKMAFILPTGQNTFILSLRDHIIEQANLNEQIDVEILEVEGFDPNSLSLALETLSQDIKGVGIIAVDHPRVREALRSAAKNGVKIVTIASDIHHIPTSGYVGIDNRAAGRLAGYVLGRFLGGNTEKKIAVFAGSLSYRGHEEREAGFKSIISEEYSNLSIVDFVEVRDDSKKAYEAANEMLKRHPELAGIYSIGAGNQGIAKALRENGRDQELVFIGHDLTESRKSLLLDGTFDAIIDQHPRVQAREAIGILTAAINQTSFNPHPPRLQIVFRENIPEF